jgi:hypothetical protein
LGGDYVLIVKENQPRLHENIRLLFDPPPGIALPRADRREARTIDHGHGRRHDTRTLVASTDWVGYTNWPHLAQAFRHERTWQEKGITKSEVQYGVTSLPASIATADRLLQLERGIGRSKTVTTTSKMSHWAKTAASSTWATDHPRWRHSAIWLLPYCTWQVSEPSSAARATTAVIPKMPSSSSSTAPPRTLRLPSDFSYCGEFCPSLRIAKVRVAGRRSTSTTR